ncbi:MAG: bifunctional UDP-N-acetylmuramoyl-tripeptide:D-alanyl-D-alanine ligase/alanine racemase [Bacteroidales bacterium]|nr:bifunctional UDP-N-acetylmuramoyl-tripeptide:D-alanyl-D-alanine ligase/alanine racemase [Bacteroidales bacterium]MCK9500095.1 bifunctional UDP-N-acetylmuramoyl-tripeptide:D-alanyl-D-alanine ligase/alanine racemase [Bacteroidales bacterium]
MQKYNLSNIAKIIGGNFLGNKNLYFSQIASDSRNITNYKDLLFFAIKGANNNGHKFIDELYKKGVRNFVICEDINTEKYTDAGFLKVENSILALQQIAGYKRSFYKKPIIAITGSNGKTIVKEWLHHILSPFYKISRSPKSYNSQIGVPLSLWLIDDKSDLAIIEAGISLPGEMQALEKIIKPEIAVINNIGKAHSANFKSTEQLYQEKAILLKNCKTTIVNKDDELLFNTVSKLNIPNTYTYSKNKNSDFFVEKIEKSSDNSLITIIFKDKKYNIKIPFTDLGSIQNAITCFGIISIFDESKINQFIPRFESLHGIEMRLETIEGIQNSIIINDAYNSDINSLIIALDYLNQKKTDKNTILIMSDILESGENEEVFYKQISQIIKEKKLKHFIGIGNKLSKYKNLFPKDSAFYLDTNEFLEEISLHAFSNKAVLLKGARCFKFEKIFNRLQYKNHLSIIETDLNSMKHNLDFFKSKIGDKTMLMVMVKAFSYGSGYREVASFLQHNRVDYLAVAFADEGIELRKLGIHLPIMVMNPNIRAIHSMIKYKLEPEIYSLKILKEFIDEIKLSNVEDFKIHIKLDTGMHRLGFCKNDIPKLRELINSCEKIKIASVFTHLSGSDSENFDYFTHEQINEFDKNYLEICQAVKYKPIRHVLNSSGILRFPQYKYEMVRLGIGLYGLLPNITNELIPVAVFKSEISQIHKINSKETVSYNRSGKINQDSVIATIPIGYADGFDRRLGNGNWEFIVNGKKAKTIGDICMDMCMIDITNIQAKEGDEVIVFGLENSVIKMAEKLNTIPYEIITGISERVKRVYFEE